MEVVQGVAIVAASVAAIADLASRRIPNYLTFGTLGLGIALNAWSHGFGGVLVALAGAGLGLAVLLPFHLLRAMGAGDVKLLAALGAVLGPQLLVPVLIYAGISGGFLSLAILLGRGRLMLALNEVLVQRRVPTPSGATAPYAVAIAAGVYLSVMLPSVVG